MLVETGELAGCTELSVVGREGPRSVRATTLPPPHRRLGSSKVARARARGGDFNSVTARFSEVRRRRFFEVRREALLYR